MKENFGCTLTGSHWWKPYLIYLVSAMVLVSIFEVAYFGILKPRDATISGVSAFLVVISSFACLLILQAVFMVILGKIAYASCSYKDKSPVFTAETGELVKVYLINALYTALTFSIYFPWYVKNITDYLVEHSVYDGEKAVFNGTGKKLFKYYALALILPVLAITIIFTAILTAVLVATGFTGDPEQNTFLELVIILILYPILFFACIPFVYLMYKWYVNIGWKTLTVKWETEFWPSCLFIAGQLLLTLITVGIYWPVFLIKAWRYFSEKTIVQDNGAAVAKLGFEGDTKQGFMLLWGQALLSIITLGVYLPWAYANCIRYFITNTYTDSL